MTLRERTLNLLKTWADALLEYQLDDPRHDALGGAILCPACSVIHGRACDAAYPLLALCDYTGDEKYLRAAKALFDWSKYMVLSDGSVYNDSQSEWRGITVFAAISLVNALTRHGHLLAPAEKARWEARLCGMGRWLHENLTVKTITNINYLATNAHAMAALGAYFGNSAYAQSARALARFALARVTPGGMLAGEGNPMDAVTPRGCRPIDIGYNVEESLPSLYAYARISGDEWALRETERALRAHLRLMLPDGAWDNSFGTRNFKWTYWGGRTSDGCQAAFCALGKTDAAFAEAAARNLALYEACTQSGLLAGGPHYAAHGELPCVHHAFCHMKVLAEALDEGIPDFPRARIPSDDAPPYFCDPEADAHFLRAGPWRMTLTGGDFDYMPGGHASGGAITLLWHARLGPLVACGNTDFSLKEAHNQQLTRRKSALAPMCVRCETVENGARYSQMYDFAAQIAARATENGAAARVTCALADAKHAALAGGECALTYTLCPDELRIEGQIPKGARLVLPIIALDAEPVREAPGEIAIERANGTIFIRGENLGCAPERKFNLAPGFEAVEIGVSANREGRVDARIRVSGV